MKIKLELRPFMVDLLTEIANITGSGGDARKSPVSEVLERMLVEVELHAKLDKLDKLDLGIAWRAAAETVRARHAAAAEPEQTDFPDVDHELLEHGKSRSGFVGVYFANGKFRAIVPDPSQGMGAKTLPGRSTALEAAVDRYRWYHEHGIPYGNLGWHITNHREQHPEKSVEEALLWAYDLVSSGTFGLKRPFTLDQVERTLAAHRKRLGLPDAVPPAGATVSRDAAEVTEILCAVCKEEIVEGEPLCAHSSSPNAWAHQGCV
jgi:hypothetical protein